MEEMVDMVTHIHPIKLHTTTQIIMHTMICMGITVRRVAIRVRAVEIFELLLMVSATCSPPSRGRLVKYIT